MQYIALAERKEVRLGPVDQAAAREVRVLGIIAGRDRLATELALAGLRAGFKVVMLAQVPAELELAQKRIDAVMQRQVARGQITQQQADRLRAALSMPQDLAALSAADLVIEAVGLGREISRQILARLEGILG